MKRRSLVVLALTMAFGGLAAAQEPRFTFERSAQTQASGRQRLAVDVTLLSAGSPFRVIQRGETMVAEGGLNDLRLFDASGRPVPYLLVHAASGARLVRRPAPACRGDQDHERLRGGLRERQHDRSRASGRHFRALPQTADPRGQRRPRALDAPPGRRDTLQSAGRTDLERGSVLSTRRVPVRPCSVERREQRPRSPAGARLRARGEWPAADLRDLRRRSVRATTKRAGPQPLSCSVARRASADRRAGPRRCPRPRVSCRVRVRVPLRRHRGCACRSRHRHARARASCGRVCRVPARHDCAARGSGARSDRRGRKQSAARSAEGVRRLRRAPLDLFRGLLSSHRGAIRRSGRCGADVRSRGRAGVNRSLAHT